MNCAEKLLEPTIFFNLYTKPPQKSSPESPRRKRDLSPTWNLEIKSLTLWMEEIHCKEIFR